MRVSQAQLDMSSVQPRQLAQRLDVGLLATILLCLFTLWPLLYRPGLPNGTDVLYHVYRTAEMDRAWSHGVLMPSWAETFYYGYGSPLFHYYASLSYYLTSILARLFNLDPVNSLRALIVLCSLLAGAGMYQFVKGRVSALGGIIAALCYVYAPYLVFTEPYARGDYPELLALSLFPWVMWRFDRWFRVGALYITPVQIILASLSVLLLIISHNLMALLLFGLLVAWLAWNMILSLTPPHRKGEAVSDKANVGWGFVLLPAFIGVGLAAYFWLPVILEHDAVQLGNLIATAELDYRRFFVPLDHLLAFSPRADAGAINGLLHQLNLGVAQWVLAITGAFVGARRVTEGNAKPLPLRGVTVFFTLLAAVMIFLMLPISEGVWAIIRPLAFLQFPWRFLGPVAFCLALLAGMNALWIERLSGHIRTFATAAIIVLPVALALPTFYIAEWEHETVDTSVAAYLAAETQGLQRGTTFSNEYLPRDVAVLPEANQRLLDDYADGYPVDKANLDALPDSVTVEPLEHSPKHDLWRVTADEPFTMEVLTLYFAGWQAEIDGVPAEITPSETHGLITFPVPAGDHTVHVFLGSTPARNIGLGVTFAALIGLALLSRQRFKTSGDQEGSHIGLPLQESASVGATLRGRPQPHLQRQDAYALLLAAVVQLALMLLFMREGIAWVHSPPGQALPAQHQRDYLFGDYFQLLGYDLNASSFRPGDRLELHVYWYAPEPVPYGYASFVHISTGGPPLAQADKLNPAGRPTKTWTADGYLRDDYVIILPADLPPGEYSLIVGLYTCDTLPAGQCGNGDRALVTDSEGNPVGDSLVLQTIQIR
jgi:hypothetical protein